MKRGWLKTLFALLPISVASAQPVLPGIDRLQDPVLRGLGLISELNCISCHDHGGGAVYFGLHKPPPSLENIGDRMDAAGIADFIRDPKIFKPGTTMPNLLHGVERKEIEPIAMWLASSKSGKEFKPFPAGNAERGRALYHSIGCVACHAPEAGYRPARLDAAVELRPPANPSVPIALARAYTRGGLIRFLLDPVETHNGMRMPDFGLSQQEASDLSAYLQGGEKPLKKGRDGPPAVLAKGRAAYARHGCAACHGGIKAEALPFRKILPEPKGCLAEAVPAGAPDYALSKGQREDILAALKDQPKKPDTLQLDLATLNCYACHERDGIGGPEAGRRDYFHSLEALDLGDEGRFPPSLTGVGRKLTHEALWKIGQGQGAVRPYMATRMPAYAHRFPAGAFRSPDRKAFSGFMKSEEEFFFYGRNPLGRELAGVEGKGCITCHNLNGRRSLGIPAVDLATLRGRLEPEWFAEYLLDPQKFRAGTRMPALFPKAKKDNRDFAHLWVYFREIAQSRLPAGMEQSDRFELKADTKPIVFRTFVEGAGMQAIAVGFPGGFNLAFDAKNCRWALAWKGRFLDAASTWQDRFTPPAKPLGKPVKKLTLPVPEGPVSFMGYRIRKDGVPVFSYRAGEKRYEDRIEASEAGLKRFLQPSGGTVSEEVVPW